VPIIDLCFMQTAVHYFFHFIFPLAVAFYFFNDNWRHVYFLFLLTMIVDVDHLLANPIFQSNRCSICYHPLHSLYAIGVYFLLLFFKKDIRIIGIGLLMHMATDFIDCILMLKLSANCIIDQRVIQLIESIT
jgi:Family of unknown function (DUF6122)